MKTFFALLTFSVLIAIAVAANAQTYNVLYVFQNSQSGRDPGALLDVHGTLFGVTAAGGPGNAGTVFRLDSQGKKTTIYNFPGGHQLSEGYYPLGPLVRDAAGNLYGTTLLGGDPNCVVFRGNDCGTVYKLSPTGQHTILHTFTGGSDGAQPQSPLVADGAGNLYGTTAAGGNGGGSGTVYKITTSGVENVLYSFTGGADSGSPAGVVVDKAGNVFGATEYGGIRNQTCSLGCGKIFKIDAAGNEIVLYQFTGGSDGWGIFAPIVRDSQGNLYGTAGSGGDYGRGTVFKMDTSGQFTVLYAFRPADEISGLSSLTVDHQGNLFGTSEYAPGNYGGVYEVSNTGVFTVLHQFDFTNGGYVHEPVVVDNAGNIFGGAQGGPLCYPDGCGVIFEITP